MTDVSEGFVAALAPEEGLVTGIPAKRTQGLTTQNVVRRVRKLRERRGWTAEDVADKCEGLGLPISRAVLANLENRRRDSLSVDELMTLAAVFEVEPAYLLASPGSRAVPIATALVGLLEKLAASDEPDPEAVHQAWGQYQLLGLELEKLQ